MVALCGIALGVTIFSSCILADPRWSAVGAGMMAILLGYRLMRPRQLRG